MIWHSDCLLRQSRVPKVIMAWNLQSGFSSIHLANPLLTVFRQVPSPHPVVSSILIAPMAKKSFLLTVQTFPSAHFWGLCRGWTSLVPQYPPQAYFVWLWVQSYSAPIQPPQWSMVAAPCGGQVAFREAATRLGKNVTALPWKMG